jgi:hypothetical protein
VRKIFAVTGLGFLTVKIALLFVMAITCLFSADEFFQAGQAREIADGYYRNVWPIKSVLYAYYYRLALWLTASSDAFMLAARVQTALLAVATLGLSYRIARTLGYSRIQALLVPCCALAFSNFMERSFEVRAEPLALAFGALALSVAVSTLHSRRALVLGMFAAGACCGLAFVSTQKAIWFALALGIAVTGDSLLRRRLREAIGFGALLLAGWAVVILAYAVAFRGTQFYLVLQDLFAGPASFRTHARGLYPWAQWMSQYIVQTLWRNAAAYGVCGAGLVLAAARLRTAASPLRVAWLFSVVLAALVFSHDQPWPYIYPLVIPFLSLWSVELFSLSQRFPSWGQVAPVAALALFLFSIGRNLDHLQYDNNVQLETSRRAEQYLGPRDSYCDGVGMVPTHRLAGRAWWDRIELALIEADVRNRSLARIDKIFADQPKLWILNWRMDRMWPIMAPFIMRSYVPVYDNIVLSGVQLTGNSDVFVTRWPGLYAVRDERGVRTQQPIAVDGKEVKGQVMLALGRHVVEAPSCRGCSLLPADSGQDLPIRKSLSVSWLFDSGYWL